MSEDRMNHQELTAAQLGIWYAQQLQPASPAYNIGEYLEIRGSLDLELFELALRQALNEVEVIHLRFWREREAVPVR